MQHSVFQFSKVLSSYFFLSFLGGFNSLYIIDTFFFQVNVVSHSLNVCLESWITFMNCNCSFTVWLYLFIIHVAQFFFSLAVFINRVQIVSASILRNFIDWTRGRVRSLSPVQSELSSFTFIHAGFCLTQYVFSIYSLFRHWQWPEHP